MTKITWSQEEENLEHPACPWTQWGDCGHINTVDAGGGAQDLSWLSECPGSRLVMFDIVRPPKWSDWRGLRKASSELQGRQPSGSSPGPQPASPGQPPPFFSGQMCGRKS